MGRQFVSMRRGGVNSAVTEVPVSGLALVLLGFGSVVLSLARKPQEEGDSDGRKSHHPKSCPVQLNEQETWGLIVSVYPNTQIGFSLLPAFNSFH
ncbi:hypothetical protein XELAEV_18042879mg [Xenopus laevis]|uniref:Uncharacterized protein n=1 Tax=Xenopus laevis TaxID=8355 RepID=A0A974C4S7_XENLA|nr:hypothetical protein XELAEV_18042879mg [Xenopus laevis]